MSRSVRPAVRVRRTQLPPPPPRRAPSPPREISSDTRVGGVWPRPKQLPPSPSERPKQRRSTGGAGNVAAAAAGASRTCPSRARRASAWGITPRCRQRAGLCIMRSRFRGTWKPPRVVSGTGGGSRNRGLVGGSNAVCCAKGPADSRKPSTFSSTVLTPSEQQHVHMSVIEILIKGNTQG